MTFLRRAGIYQCDQCGIEFEWAKVEHPFTYGSIAGQEVMAREMPTVCSVPCRDKFCERMDRGEVEVPTVKFRHSSPRGHTVRGKRRGY